MTLFAIGFLTSLLPCECCSVWCRFTCTDSFTLAFDFCPLGGVFLAYDPSRDFFFIVFEHCSFKKIYMLVNLLGIVDK